MEGSLERMCGRWPVGERWKVLVGEGWKVAEREGGEGSLLERGGR